MKFRRLLPALFAAALLSGCAEIGVQEPAPAARAPITRPDDLLAALDERARRQDRLDRSGPAAEASREDDDLPDVTPEALIGADASLVRTWLGQPGLNWREGEHAMWQYVSGECVIHLFLNGSNRIEDVALTRRDSEDATGCEHAIAERLTAAASKAAAVPQS